jgi:hypothetical protein
MNSSWLNNNNIIIITGIIIIIIKYSGILSRWFETAQPATAFMPSRMAMRYMASITYYRICVSRPQ